MQNTLLTPSKASFLDVKRFQNKIHIRVLFGIGFLKWRYQNLKSLLVA